MKKSLFLCIPVCLVIAISVIVFVASRSSSTRTGRIYYPNYDEAKIIPEISLTAVQISEHRFCITFNNRSDKAFYYDLGFELLEPDGTVIPVDHDLLSAIPKHDYHFLIRPGESSFGLTLSLLYGKLQAGTYRIVFAALEAVDGWNKGTLRYIVGDLTLSQRMRRYDYPAAPYDFDAITTFEQPEDILSYVASFSEDRNGCNFIVENRSGTAITPTGRWCLYQVLNGEYFPVQQTNAVGIAAIGYPELAAGESRNYTLNWGSVYGELKEGGHYLLAIQISDSENSPNHRQFIFGEFYYSKKQPRRVWID